MLRTLSNAGDAPSSGLLSFRLFARLLSCSLAHFLSLFLLFLFSLAIAAHSVDHLFIYFISFHFILFQLHFIWGISLLRSCSSLNFVFTTSTLYRGIDAPTLAPLPLSLPFSFSRSIVGIDIYCKALLPQ